MYFGAAPQMKLSVAARLLGMIIVCTTRLSRTIRLSLVTLYITVCEIGGTGAGEGRQHYSLYSN